MTHGAGISQLLGFSWFSPTELFPRCAQESTPKKLALSKTQGTEGKRWRRLVIQRPSPYHNAASPCLPLPWHWELPLKGFCAAETVGENKLQAANVLNTKPARCLPTQSCKTRFPKKPPLWLEGAWCQLGEQTPQRLAGPGSSTTQSSGSGKESDRTETRLLLLSGLLLRGQHSLLAPRESKIDKNN